MLKNGLKIILLDCLTGLLIGLLISAYQLAIFYTYKFSYNLISNKTNISLSTYFSGVLLFAIIQYLSLVFCKNIDGSGIPYIEKSFKENKKIDYKKGLLLTLVNSIGTTFSGFTFGSEGPSVSLSARLGTFINSILKKRDNDREKLASGIGFGCAFLSPISGLVYSLEEFEQKVNLKLLVRGLFMTFSAYLVCYFLNKNYLISISDFKMLSFEHLYLIFPIIIFSVLIGLLFEYLLLFFRYIFKKFSKNIFVKYRTFFFFLIVSLMTYFYFDLMYSGNNLIKNLQNYSLSSLILILFLRLILTSFLGSTGASGGLVLPIFTLGGIIGAIITKLLNLYFGFPLTYLPIISLISLFSLFSYITKSPLTAFTLFTFTLFKFSNQYLNIITLLPFALILFYLPSYFLNELKLNNLYQKMATI